MIFYDFLSNIQNSLKNIKWPIKGVFGVLLLTSLVHNLPHDASSSWTTFSFNPQS